MQKNVYIQLTGDVKGVLDIEDGKAFPLIFQSSDVRDLAAKKGNTSRTLTLADTPNNHALMNYYYNVNIVAGSFDINKLSKCIAIEDGLSIMDNAVMQLVKVIKWQDRETAESHAKYEVLLKDVTADFYTKLGNDELTDLDFSDFNHELTAAGVIATFGNTITQGYKYLTPFNVSNVYNLQEFSPAVYARTYFDRIFARAGFSYEWADKNDINTRFDNWIIPYNGDTPKMRPEAVEELKVKAEETTAQENEPTQAAGFNISVAPAVLDITTEIQDNGGDYNNALSVYTSPIYASGGGSLSFKVITEYEFYLNNLEGSTVYLKNTTGVGIMKYKYKPFLNLEKDGVYFGASANLFSGTNGEIQLTQEYELAAGETILATGTEERVLTDNAAAGGIEYQIAAGVSVTGVNYLGSAALRWKKTDSSIGVDASVNVGVRIKNIYIEVSPSVSSLGYGSMIYVNDFIPKKVKQSDFIKAIFTLNNLYVDIDQFNASKLILKKRDQYFDEGKQEDWTKKLAKGKEQLIQFLPSLQSKKLRLTYKPDTDEPNKGYLDNTAENYGQVEFTFDNDFVKDIEVKEVLFSPTPMGKTNFGAVTPLINGAAPKTNIRLLYDGGVYSCNEFKIINYIDSTGAQVFETSTTYAHLSHFDKPVNPTFDLNFGVCDYYFYSTVGARTNNNLFNLNWRRTLNQINTGKMLTAYFNLNTSDISRLRLSDKVFILDTWYNINRVDYDANTTAPTKVELITVDSEQKFTPFKTKVIGKPLNGDSLLSGIKNLVASIWSSNNVINTDAPVVVQGKGNLIGGDVLGGAVYGDGNTVSTNKSVVIGDGLTVDKDGVYTPLIKFPNGYEITEENATGENLFTDNLQLLENRIHDLNAKVLALMAGNVVINSQYNGTALSVSTDDTTAAADISNSNGAEIALIISNGRLNLAALASDQYANDAAAGAAGVPANTVYMTTTGELRIKL